jgi:hypothetical protein
MASVLVSKIRRRVDRKLSGFADSAISLAPLHGFLERRYARDVEKHRPTLPGLPGAARDIVSALERTGVSTAHLGSLGIPGAAEIIALAQQLVAKEMADFHAQANAGQKFVVMRGETVVANPEIFLFGLREQLLDIAEAYIGLPVGYDGVTIQHTFADGEAVSTREWHRDREDRRMLKVLVYLNDVDTNGGPFQLLPRFGDSVRAQDYLYLLTPDEQVALEAGTLGTPMDCEGPNGTAVFADTAGFFHRGKPAVGRDRTAMIFSYIAKRPQRPFFCDRSGLPRVEIRRLAHALTPRQRSAALWRETLPLPWRLIPTAPVR